MHTLPAAEFANLHFVTPTLAVGGDISAYDDELAALQLAEICSLGITHIIDVRLEWSDLDAFAQSTSHIGYLHHGMDDAGQAVPYDWFETAASWAEAAGPDAVVLAHCHMGINRGPSLGFALLLAQGWAPVEAIAAIRTARPCANVLVRRRRPVLASPADRRGPGDRRGAARRPAGLARGEPARRRPHHPGPAREGLMRLRMSGVGRTTEGHTTQTYGQEAGEPRHDPRISPGPHPTSQTRPSRLGDGSRGPATCG